MEFLNKLKILFLTVLILGIASGCGGGTIGTGPQGDDTTVSGRLLNTAGDYLANVEVTAADSNASTITDSEGRFELVAPVVDGQVYLTFSSTKFTVEASIGDIPAGTRQIEARIEVDEVRGIVSSVVLESVDTPTPIPTQTTGDSYKNDSKISQSYYGKVQNALSEPLDGVTIEIKKAKVRAKSNNLGKFSLRTTNVSGNVKFSVSYRDLNGSFSIKGVPTDKDVRINFTLKLSIEEAGIDPGTGEPKQILHAQLISKEEG